MGAYKQTLLNEYGISKVRQSRIVPIHVRYKYDTQGGITGKITTVQMGAKFSEFLEQRHLKKLKQLKKEWKDNYVNYNLIKM